MVISKISLSVISGYFCGQSFNFFIALSYYYYVHARQIV